MRTLIIAVIIFCFNVVLFYYFDYHTYTVKCMEDIVELRAELAQKDKIIHELLWLKMPPDQNNKPARHLVPKVKKPPQAPTNVKKIKHKK